ncbi:MAG: hypothetical protein C0432_02560 [Candidatus Puniceispirillum sp.]|nr:hypothetical protein [Candidatus Pelagibacter sp.]MBA4283157.1 hypothetical protein [Candidatus Puniceispirillum sp.]
MIKKILMMKMLMISSVLFAQDFDGYSHKHDRAHQRLKNYTKQESSQQHIKERESSLCLKRRKRSNSYGLGLVVDSSKTHKSIQIVSASEFQRLSGADNSADTNEVNFLNYEYEEPQTENQILSDIIQNVLQQLKEPNQYHLLSVIDTRH